ncbi:hypothetical protein EJ05DRAFT_477185 [Pseudovirgaria hyperparasitica]|uniref:FAD/NAD(P)-binding domain-containing protein n=1 Tax=Pseudovirgaria hyperparasitica TaxID=470096 RepID=A0A6A6W5Z6_9PEZI|nr:uncharacterized protein EJ05DRAFT_477185 [Pseudovirgaria hyperparasitica]KAF2756967.1 hypothetical protein EJ05DRAFT_477185 [Pseudovirgaria hyperparasitica]
MAPSIPRYIDTVIIGNGPAALILSYILHGNIPYYAGGHPDPLLDAKLSRSRTLLDVTPDLYDHFSSSLRYSTQALPINTLLDTLLRPNADTELNPPSCVCWKYEPQKAVPHIVLGNTAAPGGQWQENAVSASWDIGTLSYAEMLSLPGLTFADHWERAHGQPMPDFVRPSRREVADYLSAYPTAVGISDSIFNSQQVSGISRTRDGFMIASHNMRCKHLVLGSGTFSMNIAPQPPLAELANLRTKSEPLLVVGSGFSAADAIISASETRQIIHIFKWAPDTRPSPLRGCHHQAYPEYAGIYKKMKLACKQSPTNTSKQRPMMRRKSKSSLGNRDWSTTYEGYPNGSIKSVNVQENTATIQIQCANGTISDRTIGELRYVVGRRGSLAYLQPSLLKEVVGEATSPVNPVVSTRTLRQKVEKNFQVAPGVFIIGSLAGDTLIRHAFGSCVHTAANLIREHSIVSERRHSIQNPATQKHARERSTRSLGKNVSPHGIPSSNCSDQNSLAESSDSDGGGGVVLEDHRDLHIDRRTLPRAKSRATSPTRQGSRRCSSW